MGFKRTPEGRVFFQGANTANDESSPQLGKRRPQSNPSPQMRSPLTGEKTQGQIVTLLKTLNERLKVTQADRDRMMGELEKHRNIIEDLEDKTTRSERIALDLEHKIENQAKQPDGTSTEAAIAEMEETRRALLEMERKQTAHNKAISDKITKSTSGVTALQKRIESTEAKQSVIDERVESALTEQAKLIRKVDKAIEDRARFMRKIERIEETVIQTRDSLNAKAMVLLTEQGVAAQETDLAEDLDAQIEEASRLASIQTPKKKPKSANDIYAQLPSTEPWWKNPSVYGATAGITAFLLAGLLIGGLALNDWQMPRLGTSQNANQTIPVEQSPQSNAANIDETQSATTAQQLGQSIENMDWSIETPKNEAVAKNSSTAADINIDINNQKQLAELMETNPQELAKALNNIEPQKQSPADQSTQDVVAAKEPAKTTKAEVKPVIEKAPQAAPVKAPVENTANKPNAKQAKIIAPQIQPDADLPNVVKEIEDQAFKGIGEAQHDLAAIYTAGHGGVTQNYERAAFWFEKASENGIANASYNLGVLHHQGLGFKPDVNQAMSWYKDAAQKGHPEAQYNLGIAYIEGIGVAYDPVLASQYFRGAAEFGVMEAAYNLGLIYENGLLGDPQPDSALMWYKNAADKGSPEARQALEDLAKTLEIDLKDVNRIAETMSASEKVKAQTQQKNAPQKTPQKSSQKPVQAKPINATTNNAAPSDQGVIAQIQEYLMRNGLYPGPADGLSGALTEDAIRSYQSLNDLNATGEPSQNLLSHMLANANKAALTKEASN